MVSSLLQLSRGDIYLPVPDLYVGKELTHHSINPGPDILMAPLIKKNPYNFFKVLTCWVVCGVPSIFTNRLQIACINLPVSSSRRSANQRWLKHIWATASHGLVSVRISSLYWQGCERVSRASEAISTGSNPLRRGWVYRLAPEAALLGKCRRGPRHFFACQACLD